jgi:hypothetical protein
MYYREYFCNIFTKNCFTSKNNKNKVHVEKCKETSMKEFSKIINDIYDMKDLTPESTDCIRNMTDEEKMSIIQLYDKNMKALKDAVMNL